MSARLVIFLVLASALVPGTPARAAVGGELRMWHKVTLDFAGPSTSETALPNPFTDYRLNVTFTHPASGKSYLVPGYYAADGDAANSSAGSGHVWLAHFAPDRPGTWTYAASFRGGPGVATDPSPAAGTGAGFFDGETGSFEIAPSDKTGRDFRAKGRLEYLGKHHLRFAGSGEFFMKAGTDSPENLLAYADFDGPFKTDGQGDSLIKTWAPHVADWQAGDPVWQGNKGKGLVGAINYLAAEGLNAFSFLTMNINGDDKNVFPYLDYAERSRLDVPRLAQWEILFEHGTRKGMYLHFKTQEKENQEMLDGGNLGPQRKLYYRELIARFSHHLALNWNLGEECTVVLAKKQAWAQYFHDTDPYHHNIVIHNGSNHRDLMGDASEVTGFSLQRSEENFSDTFFGTKDYVDRSFNAGKPWVVACDEPGDSRLGLRPDNDPGNSHVDARKNALWGNIMAGGAGCEFYFGYDKPQSDLTLQDFRSRDAFWDFCRHSLQFLAASDVPFELMKNQNALVSGNGENANRCLARTGDSYLVQLHGGGTHTLNLAGVSGQFTVQWFNPRSGGSPVARPAVSGGGIVSLGSPPDTPTQDWIVLVRPASGGGASNTAPTAHAGPDQNAFHAGASVQVNLAGTVADDGLPDVSALTRVWSLVSGPAPVTIAHPGAAATSATFTAPGSYTLRLSADDTEFTSADDAVVTISAATANHPPVFAGFSASTFVNIPLVLHESQILASATDPDGDPLSLVPDNDSSALGGSVSIAGGTLTYVPVIDLSGADSVALTVQDGRGGYTTATLSIQVFPDDGIAGFAPPTLERLPGNQIRLRFTGSPGFDYTFQRSLNLLNWSDLQTLSPLPNGFIEFTDPAPPPGKSFYRLTAP